MISFRFHIVSIVAVFLALAIGIVVGSTVIDRAIVEGLRNRVDEVSDNLDERQAANDRLQTQVDQLEAFANDSAAITVDQRLPDTVAVVITDEGVDRDPVDRTIELLGQAGSTVRGVLTFDSSWTLEDPEQQAALAEVVDVDVDAPVEEVQDRAAALLVADLSSAVEVVDDGTGALDEIADLGLVDFEVLNDVVAPRPQRVLFVVVSGPASDAGRLRPHRGVRHGGPGRRPARWSSPRSGASRRTDRTGPTPWPPSSARPRCGARSPRSTTSTWRRDPTTVVLALVAGRRGEVGHYGVGDGADTAAPAAPPPTTTP